MQTMVEYEIASYSTYDEAMRRADLTTRMLVASDFMQPNYPTYRSRLCREPIEDGYELHEWDSGIIIQYVVKKSSVVRSSNQSGIQ